MQGGVLVGAGRCGHLEFRYGSLPLVQLCSESPGGAFLTSFLSPYCGVSSDLFRWLFTGP